MKNRKKKRKKGATMLYSVYYLLFGGCKHHTYTLMKSGLTINVNRKFSMHFTLFFFHILV